MERDGAVERCTTACRVEDLMSIIVSDLSGEEYAPLAGLFVIDSSKKVIKLVSAEGCASLKNFTAFEGGTDFGL